MSDTNKGSRKANTKIVIMLIPAFILLVIMGIAMGSMTDSFVDYYKIGQKQTQEEK